jgi:NAD(P)-dependent dehydrogenase (short-subunit alcohol dehydrogenase family)
VDYVKRGIRCNCICPARIQTPFVEGYLREHYPGREDEMRKALEAYQRLDGWARRRRWPRSLVSLLRRSRVRHRQAYPIDGGVLVA